MKTAIVGKGPIYEAVYPCRRWCSMDKASLLVNIGRSYIYKASDIVKYPRGIINVHTSLLPKYRGRHPVDWAMEFKEQEIGITVHYIDTGIDTGDIILQDSVPYYVGEGYDSVIAKLVRAAPRITLTAIEQIEHNCVYRRKQDERQASYYPKRLKPRIY